MSRSVAVPRNAVWTLYFEYDLSTEPGDENEYDPDNFQYMVIDQIQEELMVKFPSFWKANSWLGREEHIILENNLGKIVLCEYCNLCSLSFVPGNEYIPDLAQHFGEQIKPTVEAWYGELTPVNWASNGERSFIRNQQ